MINSVAKADSLVRQLKEKLEFYFGVALVSESRDADGWPILGYNSELLLRVKGEDAVSKDIFGNSFAAYAPHILNIACISTISREEYSKILHECSKLGIKLAINEVVGAPVAADLNSFDFEIRFDMQWPGKGV